MRDSDEGVSERGIALPAFARCEEDILFREVGASPQLELLQGQPVRQQTISIDLGKIGTSSSSYCTEVDRYDIFRETMKVIQRWCCR